MARLDRLAPTKETVQIGACIGRQFTHELMAAVSPLGEPELTEALEQLVQSQLIFRKGTPPEAVYTFKHALIQDAAHESLLKSRRRVLHSAIARVLVGAAAAGTDIRPEFIAQHFTEAGLLPEAVDWWATAGEQAGQRSANAEAVAHYRQAIDLLAGLPESGARHRAGSQSAGGSWLRVYPPNGLGRGSGGEVPRAGPKGCVTSSGMRRSWFRHWPA